MLRLTGPGKIRDLPVSPLVNQTTTSITSLYNFDIDGDAVKPQHRDWLKEHVAPQLGDSAVRISLRGQASRTGNEDYNVALSNRRVKNVEAFLRGLGDVQATIALNNVGEQDAEAAGERDGGDDEEFRAVKVTIEHSAQRLVSPTFHSEGDFPGFDDVVANPPWLMLPAGAGFRTMRILNGQGLTLVSSNRGIVRVRNSIDFSDGPVVISKPSETFRLSAGIVSNATITAVDRAGKPHATLAVSVLRERKVTCAFHYVQNDRYGTRTRHIGDEVAFVEKLNEVWGNQANVVFELGGRVRNLTLKEDFGDIIDTRSKFDRLTKHGIGGVQFNVFFVRAVQKPDGENDDDDAVTNIGPPGNCVFEDEAAGALDPLELCHEAGHCLTLDHDTPIPTRNNMLMFRSKDGFGPFLPKVHVLRARSAILG